MPLLLDWIHKSHLSFLHRIIVHQATSTELPDLLHSPHTCERCYSNRECMLVTAATNNVVTTKRSHGSLIQHFTGHLNEVEFKYFREWDRLIDVEAYKSNHNISKAWLMSSMERERSSGKCMSSLVVSEFGSQGENGSFAIKLERSTDAMISTPLDELKFEDGSRVVLSTDGNSLFRFGHKEKFAILRGTTKSVECNCITIRVEEADIKRISGMNISETEKQSQRFRLDKDDFSVGTGTLRQNLIDFFTSDIPPFAGKLGLTQELLSSIHERTKRRLPWLRRSIIHLDAPNFDSIGVDSVFDFSPKLHIDGCQLSLLAKEYKELNPNQQNAIVKVSEIPIYPHSFVNPYHLPFYPILHI